LRLTRPDLPFILFTIILVGVLLLVVRFFWPDLNWRETSILVRVLSISIIISTLSAGMIIPFLYHRKQRQRFRDGRCRTCGYDLRVHHLGQRCPECSTPILSKPKE